jgi:ABC-type transporter Mla subunit MlaD
MPTAYQRDNLQAMLGLFLEAEGRPLPEYSQLKSPSTLSRFLNESSLCCFLEKIKMSQDFSKTLTVVKNSDNKLVVQIEKADEQFENYLVTQRPDATSLIVTKFKDEILGTTNLPNLITNLSIVPELFYVAENALAGNAMRSKVHQLHEMFLDLTTDSVIVLDKVNTHCDNVIIYLLDCFVYLEDSNTKRANKRIESSKAEIKEMLAKITSIQERYKELYEQTKVVYQNLEGDTVQKKAFLDKLKDEITTFEETAKQYKNLIETLEKQIKRLREDYQYSQDRAEAEQKRRELNTHLEMGLRFANTVTQGVVSAFNPMAGLQEVLKQSVPQVTQVIDAAKNVADVSKQVTDTTKQVKETVHGASESTKDTAVIGKVTSTADKVVSQIGDIAEKGADFVQKITSGVGQTVESVTAKEEEAKKELEKAKSDVEEKENQIKLLKDDESQKQKLEEDIQKLKDKKEEKEKNLRQAQANKENLIKNITKMADVAGENKEASQAGMDKWEAEMISLRNQMREREDKQLEFQQKMEEAMSAIAVKKTNFSDTEFGLKMVEFAMQCTANIVAILNKTKMFWDNVKKFTEERAELSNQTYKAIQETIKEIEESPDQEEELLHGRKGLFNDKIFTREAVLVLCSWQALKEVCYTYKVNNDLIQEATNNNFANVKTIEEAALDIPALAKEVLEKSRKFQNKSKNLLNEAK